MFSFVACIDVQVMDGRAACVVTVFLTLHEAPDDAVRNSVTGVTAMSLVICSLP